MQPLIWCDEGKEHPLFVIDIFPDLEYKMDFKVYQVDYCDNSEKLY